MENERYQRIINALEQLIKQGEKGLLSIPESYHSSNDTQDDVNIDFRNQERLAAAILNSDEMATTRASYLLSLSNLEQKKTRVKNNEPLLRPCKRPGNNELQKSVFSSSNNSWGKGAITANVAASTIGIVFITMAISAHSVYSYSRENVVPLLLFLFSNRKGRTDTIMISLMDRISCHLLHKSPHTLLPHYINFAFQILSLCFLQ